MSIDGLLGEAREDFEVIAVSSLAEAAAAITQRCIDVILLDLGLPDGRGLESLDSTLGFAGDVPIVVLTCSANEELGTEASRMGAQDHLVKGETAADTMERSIAYAIERKRAQVDIRDAVQSYADLVKELPSGLLTFQYEWPGRFVLLTWNPRGEDVLGLPLRVGMDLREIPALEPIEAAHLSRVLETGAALDLKGHRFKRGREDADIDLRAFSIPCRRLCLTVDDVTDRVREEELRREAYRQIEKNIEHFASLVDEIRNPNSIIIGVAERMDCKGSRSILTQAERIESLINRLDEQWVASEHVRQFLQRSMPPSPD